MSLLLAATIVATVVPASKVELASPTVYVSEPARAAIKDGTVANLACIDLPKRSRKFRTACLTSAEWEKASKLSAVTRRHNGGYTHEQFTYQPVPATASPYQSAGTPR